MFRYFSKKIKVIGSKLRIFLFFFLLSSSIFADIAGVSITSDHLAVAFKEDHSEFIFSGNVQINAPLFSAKCTRAQVINAGKTQDLSCDLGNIRRVSIEGPITFTQDQRSCHADFAEIIPAESLILLTGNATLNDPMGNVSANEIRINYVSKTIEISNTVHTPVQIDIYPNGKGDQKSTTPSENFTNYSHSKTSASSLFGDAISPLCTVRKS